MGTGLKNVPSTRLLRIVKVGRRIRKVGAFGGGGEVRDNVRGN